MLHVSPHLLPASWLRCMGTLSEFENARDTLQRPGTLRTSVFVFPGCYEARLQKKLAWLEPSKFHLRSRACMAISVRREANSDAVFLLLPTLFFCCCRRCFFATMCFLLLPTVCFFAADDGVFCCCRRSMLCCCCRRCFSCCRTPSNFEAASSTCAAGCFEVRGRAPARAQRPGLELADLCATPVAQDRGVARASKRQMATVPASCAWSSSSPSSVCHDRAGTCGG